MNEGTPKWWRDSVVYHLYPLGYCGAPDHNNLRDSPVSRLPAIERRLEWIREMGFTALYLGPLFESSSHGYDTVDYFRIDRRLGDGDDLTRLVERAHALGIRVILDGVFNHVGRQFWAFRHLRDHGAASPYRSWFRDIDGTTDNRYGDGFSYRGWEGTDTLVTLNHDEPAVVDHLLGAVEEAVRRYDIDGLRLDVAYLLPRVFLEELRGRVDALKNEFLLLGEFIHGDYDGALRAGTLDSVTNYQGYKALWSAHNDGNYFELAHTLDRLADTRLYNFVDNHDVDRIADRLDVPGHRFPVHVLLFTMPGVPSIYYGSELGARGRKEDGDRSLRPSIDALESGAPTDERLREFIAELATVRSRSRALRHGEYRPLLVRPTQFAFVRSLDREAVLVMVNADPDAVRLHSLPEDVLRKGRCLFSGDAVDLAAEAAGGDRKSAGGPLVPAFGCRIVRLDGVQ